MSEYPVTLKHGDSEFAQMCHEFQGAPADFAAIVRLWCKGVEGGKQRLADAFGVTEMSVDRWSRGRCKPNQIIWSIVVDWMARRHDEVEATRNVPF